MFLRQKKNSSGKISVQVIDKTSGKYKVLHTIGCSNNASDVERMVEEGKMWISKYKGEITMDFTNHRSEILALLEGVESFENIGIELLLGKLFNDIGFHAIKDELFKYLVLGRLCLPSSKLKTTDYLYKYHNISIDVEAVYRYMDKLHSKQKEVVQRISYLHTLKVLDSRISIVFYDVTTLYFEIESEDELRKTGFSKDGKHQNPQIVLGLLVAKQGYPLAYEIFEGKKFEGHTMMPILNTFKEKYKIPELLVVADAGLLSKENIRQLTENGYKYILGARLKSSSEAIKQAVLSLKLSNGESRMIAINSLEKLIVSYSDKRSIKDAFNRKRGIEKLQSQITSGKLGKKNINNRGYNRFLKIENEVNISLDENKVNEDMAWDGLKGYITNTDLSKDEIIDNYKHLWQIEKAFRVSKTDLKVRPIYHRIPRRIEAHICITFAAYKIYKELERQLKLKQSDLSPEKAIEIAKTINQIKIIHPVTKEQFSKTLILKEEQQNLANLFGF
jgi:transposase